MEHCAHTNYVVLICEPDNFVLYVEFWRSHLRATPLHYFMCYLFARHAPALFYVLSVCVCRPSKKYLQSYAWFRNLLVVPLHPMELL
jgi:hypothetical protein